MKSFFLSMAIVVLCGGVALAENVIVTTTITTAQQDAETMARTGVLRHCGRSGGRREGIGMGPTPQAAERACCFYGRYKIVEKGVAYSPVTRRYYAVIRYE
jgi:hypothetical protein